MSVDLPCAGDLYTKNGGYFGISPCDEIDTKELPKQAECAAIITSDSDSLSFWAEDFSQIHIFVTYDENGLIDSYRIEYGDSPIYDGETEVAFDDLYQQAEEDYRETYRAEIPGTVEYQFKQEAAWREELLEDYRKYELDPADTAEESQQNAPGAAAEVAPAMGNRQDQPRAREVNTGNLYAEARREASGGAGPPPPKEKGKQGVNSSAAG